MSNKTQTSHIEAAIRRPGESEFSAPLPVSGPGLPKTTDVAVSPDGSITVVWKEWTSAAEDDSVIRLATMPAGSDQFSDPETLSEAGSHFSPPKVAASPTGEVFAVWDRDVTGDESRIFLAGRTDPSSKPLIQEFPRKGDREDMGRPCYPNVVVGRNGAAIVTWNGWGRHWIFREKDAGPQEWSQVNSLNTEAPYGTLLHPDGLAIIAAWDGEPQDDPDREDEGLLGRGEIGLYWRDASGVDPERNGGKIIRREESVQDPVAALGHDGSLAFAFTERSTLKVAGWSPGEDWREVPELIALEPEQLDEPTQLLMGPGGETTVVWIAGPEYQGTSVFAATRPSVSGPFEKSYEVAKVSGEKLIQELVATCDDSGTITAGWWAGRYNSEEGSFTRKGDSVITATKPAGEPRFRDSVEIEGVSGNVKHLSMATAADGTTALAWTSTNRK